MEQHSILREQDSKTKILPGELLTGGWSYDHEEKNQMAVAVVEFTVEDKFNEFYKSLYPGDEVKEPCSRKEFLHKFFEHLIVTGFLKRVAEVNIYVGQDGDEAIGDGVWITKSAHCE